MALLQELNRSGITIVRRDARARHRASSRRALLAFRDGKRHFRHAQCPADARAALAQRTAQLAEAPA